VAPLFVTVVDRFSDIGLLVAGAGAIEHADDVGFEFNDRLLNRVFDALALPGVNLDRAIVVSRGQLALHENMSAFYEPLRQLLKAAVTKFSVATRKSWKDENNEWKEKTQWHNVVAFGKGGAIRQLLGFCAAADVSNDGKLIRFISFFLFLPCCAWAQKREAGCSQTWERAFSGDRKVFRRVCERRSPVNFVVGPKPLYRCAFLNGQKKQAQSRTGASAGRNGCRLKRAKHIRKERGIRHEPDSSISWSQERTHPKPGANHRSDRGAFVQKAGRVLLGKISVASTAPRSRL
jgi:Single-strand binding protein family